jgi:hypothetical protein
MKTFRTKPRLQRFAAATVAVMLGGLPLDATADSPVGDWDLYIAGSQRGVALLTFNPDYSLSGIEIHNPGTLPKKPSDNPRGDINEDNPRGGTTVSGPNEFHYGSSVISGAWGYGLNGKIVGSMILSSANITNGWSFTGVAKGVSGSNPRITLSVTRSDSGLKSVMRGVIRAPLPDISGNYSQAGTMRNRINNNSQDFSQIVGFSNPSGNIYDVSEIGPGYQGSGFAILTRNQRIGIYTEHVNPADGATNIVVLSGTFSTNKLRGSLTGYDGDKFGIKAKIVNFPLSP